MSQTVQGKNDWIKNNYDKLILLVLLLGLLAGRMAAALLQDLGDLHLDLVRGLLQLQILAELLGQQRHVLFGDLGVGVGVDLDALVLEEVHQVVETDVELSE